MRSTVMMPVKILLDMMEFNAANTMYHITKPMGVAPKWALDYRMGQGKWVEGFDLEEFLSMDVSYLVDSLGKGISDMYEDEGITYVIGNVAANIVAWKFLGELKNLKAPVVANEAYDAIGTTTVFDFDSGMFLESEIVRLTGQNALVSMVGGEVVPWGEFGKRHDGRFCFWGAESDVGRLYWEEVFY